MTTTTIFFDLDDTLYPRSSGLWNAVKERINLYMQERLGFADTEINELRSRLFDAYGTTLRGLQCEFHVDTQDYLSFIHDVPIDHYLAPDRDLQRMLKELSCRKVIFTNADEKHASRVINTLGLCGCFNAIVDINSMAPYCKPMSQTFDIAMKIAGESDPSSCVLVDDLPRITSAARQAGFFTVLIGKSDPHPDADAVLMHLVDLPDVLP